MVTSVRCILSRSPSLQWNDISCLVTALLSLVPANPMASLDTPSSLAIILTRRLVSQLRQVTVATV